MQDSVALPKKQIMVDMFAKQVSIETNSSKSCKEAHASELDGVRAVQARYAARLVDTALPMVIEPLKEACVVLLCVFDVCRLVVC